MNGLSQSLRPTEHDGQIPPVWAYTPTQQAKEGKEFFARKASIEYFASARFDDVIDIGVRCAKLGNSSTQFIYEIYVDEQHLVSGEISYVYVDTSIRKGVAIPTAWREAIKSLEKMQPSE